MDNIMLDDNCIEHLKRIDLNSVMYFVAVMKYRTVFNASIVLDCSSPTVSLMLKRFCSYFPVPLFEREGRCLVPTRYAKELYIKIEQTCIDFNSLLECDQVRLTL